MHACKRGCWTLNLDTEYWKLGTGNWKLKLENWMPSLPGINLEIKLLTLLTYLHIYLHIYLPTCLLTCLLTYLLTYRTHVFVFPRWRLVTGPTPMDEASQRPFGFGSAHTNAKLSPFPAAAALAHFRLQRPWQCGAHPFSTSSSNNSNHNHNRKRIPRSTSPSPNTNSSNRTALPVDPFPSTLSHIPLPPLQENRTRLATHAGLLPTRLPRCVDRSLEFSLCHP